MVRRQLPVPEQHGLAPHLPPLGVGQIDIGIQDEIPGRQGLRRHPFNRGPVDPAALDLGQGLAQEVFPGQQPAHHQGVAFLGQPKLPHRRRQDPVRGIRHHLLATGGRQEHEAEETEKDRFPLSVFRFL